MEDRRQHVRKSNPLVAVTVRGKSYPAIEWSFGGFLLAADPADLPPGALIKVEGIGRGKSKPTAVSIRARVVRACDDGESVAVTALHLDDQAYRVLGELDG